MYEMKTTDLSTQLVNREAWIMEKAAGQSVLHLGATDAPYTKQRFSDGNLLHQELEQFASHLTGMDIATAEIDWLRDEHGISSIVPGNVEIVDDYPSGHFDLIIMGEILEHLSNPGRALDAIAQVTKPGTALLVTVPNANSLKGTLRAGLSKELVHKDHVAYFSISTLSGLLNRHGFEVDSFCYYASNSKGKLAQFASSVLKLRPSLAEGLCVLARTEAA